MEKSEVIDKLLFDFRLKLHHFEIVKKLLKLKQIFGKIAFKGLLFVIINEFEILIVYQKSNFYEVL